ncbi:hypothetical protein HY837_04395 [archaeon]|nr:hypothetical protein [archaeon]
MQKKSATLIKDNLSVKLNARKSEFPGHNRVEVTFPDTYKLDLNEHFNWDENAIDSTDVQIFGRLKCLDAFVSWEDDEFFTVDLPQDKEEEPVVKVYEALEQLLTQTPYDVQQIEELRKKSDKAKETVNQILENEIAKVREERTLFRGYKHNPSATFGHEGYCIVKLAKVKKTKGLTYDEESFTSAHRKIVTKPGVVLLEVSVNGDPFMKFYGAAISRDSFYTYQSIVLKELLALAEDSSGVIKSENRIGTTTGDSEKLNFLCTEEFAKRVNEYLSNKFSYLDTN